MFREIFDADKEDEALIPSDLPCTNMYDAAGSVAENWCDQAHLTQR